MAAETSMIMDKLNEIKTELDFIKNILSENYELSDSAKKQLKIARDTPESEYVDIE